MDELFLSIWIRVLQMAARQHSLLSSVKGDGAEFFPIAYSRIFYD